MIALLTPYGRSETTLAALAVAEVVSGRGGEVKLLSPWPVALGIDPGWDRVVRAVRLPEQLARALKGATAVVHFHPAPGLLRRARRAAPQARQVLVLRPALAKPPYRAVLRGYDTIVTPSVDGLRVLSEGGLTAVQGVTLNWMLFDGGPTPLRRPPGLRRPGSVRLAVVADRATTRTGETLPELLGLLGRLPDLRLSLLSCRSWAKPLRRRLRRAALDYPGRLAVGRYRGLDDLTAAFEAADWAHFAGTGWEFGTTAARALACGAPVIAYNAPPLSEMLSDGFNSVLLACNVEAGGKLVPRPGELAARGLKVLAGPAALERLQGFAWKRAQRQAEFWTYWTEALGLA